MEGFERYQKLMTDWAREWLGPYLKPETRDDTPSGLQKYSSNVFFGFTDISETVDTLYLAQTLVSTSPPRSKKIQRDEYLKYQVNAYLQEVYILNERLIAYPKKVQRAYKGTEYEARFTECVEPLHSLISGTLRGIVETRGYHVHAARFSDRDLDFLSRLDLLARFDSRFKEDANFEYGWAKRQWGDRIKTNNKETMKMLNTYFSVMEKAIAPSGNVLMPSSIGAS